ncbi:phosphoenolpyruvate synthase [Microgenomates group bacterium RBG_16_45_19]|nr:MAG: phosphoenolpyruvate synthase [Microgenomates group bacterium RBG_16_45_19]
MSHSPPLIAWFKDISKSDLPLVGGKGANLGEMFSAHIPVPDGFCVTAPAYYQFLEATQLQTKIRAILKDLDVNQNTALFTASRRIKQLIVQAPMPEAIQAAIIDHYHQFPHPNEAVAVRSSATAEDLPDASFAGQQATYLNIQGDEAVVKAVQKCWASLFEARAIFYRQEKGFNHFKVGIAVPIQRMVQSDVSGVMFTVNPVNNDPFIIIVESVYGLGEMIVQGSATPDHFEVDRQKWTIRHKEISRQTAQLTRVSGLTKVRPVPVNKQSRQKVSDEVILKVAKLGQKLQDHYHFPQDIEWAYENGEVYIVQTRPITTMTAVGKKTDQVIGEIAEIVGLPPKALLSGSPASPGIVTGVVKIIKDPKDNDLVEKGDILVAPMTTPDFVPAMKRAVAIVTDQGGQTSHAAIVSRELGVPCVVGTQNATKKLKNHQLITVDASAGVVYPGRLKIHKSALKLPQGIKKIRQLKTRTKVYVNLGEPDMAGGIAQKYVDGVGLLRAEFIISEYIGVHPKLLLETSRRSFFVKKLAEGLEDFCRAFNPRPIIYRTTDFKTNEYRGLTGGDKYEPEEPNPMIGYRGCHRYLIDDDVFQMELDVIKRVRDHLGYKNLHLMIPFVRTVKHLAQIKTILAKAGLQRRPNFKLYMMAEIPNNVLLMDEFIDEGIDGVSIGSNDLTMLMLGTDRDNQLVADVYDERDPGVLKALEIIVRTCKRRGVAVSICGQAPSIYPEITKKLVEWGATSVSVSPDMIDKTRLLIYQMEQIVHQAKPTVADTKRKKTLTLFQRIFKAD